MSPALAEKECLELAVVGGGIAGIALAIGLLRHNVKVKVYEQSRGFREIGAGIAFTKAVVGCMELIDPALGTALKSSGSVSVSDGNKTDPNDYLRWLDGYNQPSKEDPYFERKLCDLDAGYKGFYGCRRDQFLEAAGKVLPGGVIEFGKRVESIEEREGQKIQLTFKDGSSAKADAVFGCDGIKSRVRELLFGKDNPASYPHYTHFVAFRGLVPMDQAIDALGNFKATNFHHHIGPDSHITHYPVANNTMLNVTGFVLDPNEWPDVNNMVASGSRDALVESFKGWNPSVLALLNLLPEDPIRWAVFDTWDYPAPFYNRGRMCLVGDAAHASSPHHGGGAGIGIEDALCLATVIGQVVETCRRNPQVKDRALTAALGIYDSMRRTRSQWLVNSSRRVCDLYHLQEWADPAKWIKAQTVFEEIKDRSHKLWNFNSQKMIDETIAAYKLKREEILGAVPAKSEPELVG